MKLGILGMGKMGEAIAQGLKKSAHAKNFSIQGTTRSQPSADHASQHLGFKIHTDNAKLIRDSK